MMTFTFRNFDDNLLSNNLDFSSDFVSRVYQRNYNQAVFCDFPMSEHNQFAVTSVLFFSSIMHDHMGLHIKLISLMHNNILVLLWPSVSSLTYVGHSSYGDTTRSGRWVDSHSLNDTFYLSGSHPQDGNAMQFSIGTFFLTFCPL